MEIGVLQPTKKETPQGGNLSLLLSNIMLNELDKELEARGLVNLIGHYLKVHIITN